MTFNRADFVHYLESMVNLNALDRMTNDLDEELKDAQLVMNDIKRKIDSLSQKTDQYSESEHESHEDLSSFLSAGTPKLLMDDMVDDVVDIDLDDVIATLKSYTEDIKKNLTRPVTTETRQEARQIESLDLQPYATSLDQLCKRISNLKLCKEEGKRNAELEEKLTILCDDVNMFTKMVAAKKSLSEANQNWNQSPKKTDGTLEYDILINKLLSGINEVSYLLQNSK